MSQHRTTIMRRIKATTNSTCKKSIAHKTIHIAGLSTGSLGILGVLASFFGLCLPCTFASIGIASAFLFGLLTFITEYKLLFIVLSLMMLGTSFYLKNKNKTCKAKLK